MRSCAGPSETCHSTRHSSATPTTASASSRSTSGRPMPSTCRAPTRRVPGASCSASTTPIRQGPIGRRWKTSPRAPPGFRSCLPALPTHSVSAFRPSRRRWRPRWRASRSARTHVRLDTHLMSRASVDWLVELLGGQHVDPRGCRSPSASTLRAFWPEQAACACRSRRCRASLPQSLAHYFAIGVPGVLLEADGRVFHNAGATEAQELGAALASAVWHLRMFEDARQPLLYAVPKIGFALAVDQDQFLSMAKIRAMRMLWARALEACGIEPNPVTIHAETSFRMMTAQGSGNQHPAQHDCLLRRRHRRRGHGVGAAAHHRARPARRVRPAHRPQHAGHPGRREPCRLRQRPRFRLRRDRDADGRAVRGRLGRIPPHRSRGRHPGEPGSGRAAAARQASAVRRGRRSCATGTGPSSAPPSIRPNTSAASRCCPWRQPTRPRMGRPSASGSSRSATTNPLERLNDSGLRRHGLAGATVAPETAEGRILGDARGHRGRAILWREGSRRPALSRQLARRGSIRARPLSDHVCAPALDDPAICRLLHGRGIECLLPAQSRRRPEGLVRRLRPGHPSRLRQRPSARGRRCRHGRRGDRFHPRHASAVRRHPARQDDACR